MIEIKQTEIGKNFPLPTYATNQSAGLDLYASIIADVIINPGEVKLISAGIMIGLKPGYEAQIRPRSGLALKSSITVLNSPGTIDADYRGEIGVILINHGKESFTVTPGARIAQMVIAKFVQAEFVETNELSTTDRGEGGFGSTGK